MQIRKQKGAGEAPTITPIHAFNSFVDELELLTRKQYDRNLLWGCMKKNFEIIERERTDQENQKLRPLDNILSTWGIAPFHYYRFILLIVGLFPDYVWLICEHLHINLNERNNELNKYSFLMRAIGGNKEKHFMAPFLIAYINAVIKCYNESNNAGSQNNNGPPGVKRDDSYGNVEINNQNRNNIAGGAKKDYKLKDLQVIAKRNGIVYSGILKADLKRKLKSKRII